MILHDRKDGPGRPPRFLFLQYEPPLGTAALATAIFAALRDRCPDARITVAAAGLPANVLRASPLIDELIVTPHPLSSLRAALGFFLTRIRPRRDEFDYVATDSGNARTKVSLLALASGVRRRVGFVLKSRLYHAPLAFDRERSNIANSLRVLDLVGLPGPARGPAIHFSGADLKTARALIGEASSRPGPRIALVTQTSRGHPNAWFDDRWIELARRLSGESGARLLFVGAGGDRSAIDAIRGEIPAPTLSLAGRTDIPELAAVLALCDLTVTIDTGGLHVARAVDAPTVVLGHAATAKQTWLPLGEPLHRILLHDYVPCAYCGKMACATRECMQESTVEVVLRAVREQLAAYPPSEAARAARVAARLNPES